jgi:DNA-binding GntR family transcriptional regulator
MVMLMDDLERGATRSDDMHRRLRADILSGRRSPGERLKFQELCDTYSASVGAAREALTRLVGEGLARVQPRHGYTVTPLSLDDLQDLTEARAEIESTALRLAIKHGDMAWESGVVGAHHALERTPLLSAEDPERVSDEWAQAHTAFHFSLLAGCPNRRILNVARDLRQEASLYHLWSVAFQRKQRRDAAGEHRALLDATIARDTELATQLLRDHITHTAQLLIDSDPK